MSNLIITRIAINYSKLKADRYIGVILLCSSKLANVSSTEQERVSSSLSWVSSANILEGK